MNFSLLLKDLISDFMFIFPSDLFYLIGNVKTGKSDSDKAQVIENVTQKY